MGTKSYEVLAAEEKCKVFFEWFELLLELSIQDLKAVEAAPKMNNNDGFSEYGNRRPITEYVQTNDRTFPLDTVKIKGFEKKYNTILETPLIHYGAQADEITRAMHVIALAIGKDIYIRSGHYKPETEEGRALLVHELTHVAQNKNRALTDNRTKSELEAEAEAKERGEIYSSDKELTIRVHGKLMRFPQSQKQRIADSIAKDIVAAAEQAENGMEEEKYLRYLCRFKEKVERGDTRWLE